MRVLAFILLSLVLGACTPSAPDVSRVDPKTILVDLPPMKRFDGTQPRVVPMPSNTDLARDFIELHFALESGKPLTVFSRFEGPITLTVAPNAPASLSPDLDQLLVRLRGEADIDIRRVPPGAGANITIEALPKRELDRLFPGAACVVFPNIGSWAGYLSVRSQAKLSWEDVNQRRRAAIFLREDSSPQDIRDCLHEEIAQALAPLNDLPHLPWTVFNDDNLHSVLTSYDMMILRTAYHPKLRSGMTQSEVEARLPSILRQIHPEGALKSSSSVVRATPAYKRKLARVFAPSRQSDGSEIAATRELVEQARLEGLTDVRLGYALLLYGNALLTRGASGDISPGLEAVMEARYVFQKQYGAEVHFAAATIQPAAYAASIGDYDAALRLTAQAKQAARLGQNPLLMSRLLQIEAHALEGLGQVEASKALSLEARAYERYGFGDGKVVQDRVSTVAALRPGI